MGTQLQEVALETQDMWRVDAVPGGDVWGSFSFENNGLAVRCDGPGRNLSETISHITAQAARMFTGSEVAYDEAEYGSYLQAYEAAVKFREACVKSTAKINMSYVEQAHRRALDALEDPLELQMNKALTAINLQAGKLMVAFTTNIYGTASIHAARLHDIEDVSGKDEARGKIQLTLSGKHGAIGQAATHFTRAPGLFLSR